MNIAEQIKNTYCDKSANTNNCLFQIGNCVDLIKYYTVDEPNKDEVMRLVDELQSALKEIGTTHQQEYYIFEALRNLFLAK